MSMDVFDAVDSRISCRWFLDRPVDPAIVRDIIARASRAASGGNLQSWQVYALTGAPLADIKRRVAEFIAGHDPRHDDAEYPIYPKTMWEPYKSRREEHGVQLYGALKIARDDAEGRLEQYKRNFQFFNAPVALFIAIDRKLGPGQWADLGGYARADVSRPRLQSRHLPAGNPGPACIASSARSSKCRRSRCCSAPSRSATAIMGIRRTAFARRARRLRISAGSLVLSDGRFPRPAVPRRPRTKCGGRGPRPHRHASVACNVRTFPKVFLQRQRSFTSEAPSTTLRVVPLPRGRGGGHWPFLLMEIARHALPRLALGSADVVRRRLENVLTRLRLHAGRDAVERAFQAHMRVAATAAMSPARFAPARPPQRERVAIASLLQLAFDRNALRMVDRAQLRSALEPRLHHGGEHPKFGIFHDTNSRVLAARFCARVMPRRAKFLRRV